MYSTAHALLVQHLQSILNVYQFGFYPKLSSSYCDLGLENAGLASISGYDIIITITITIIVTMSNAINSDVLTASKCQ